MTKRGMRGFAVGLWVAAALIAYFFYTGQGPVKTEAEPSITEEEVQQYLQNNDQVAVDKATYQSLKTASNNDPKEENGNQKDDKDKDSSNSGQKENKKQEVSTYTLQIEKGMTSQKIGSLLKDAKIISNEDKLSDYLQNNDLAKKVQIGTFELKSDMSVAEIAKKITS